MPTVKELASIVDQYIATRESRLALERQAERIKEDEQVLKAKLIEGLSSSEAKSIGGTAFRATLRDKQVPQVSDWRVLYDYIRDNDAFDLLQKRLSGPAVQARVDEGETITGVVYIPVLELSINKL